DLHGRSGSETVWDLHWQGDVDYAPLSSKGHFRLARLSLPWLSQSVGQHWPVQLRKGQADFEADYQLAETRGQQRLALEDAAVDVRDLDALGKDRLAPELSLRQLHAQAAGVDNLSHRVVGQMLSVESPELVLHRSEDGQIDLVSLARQVLKSKSPPPSVA